METKNLWKEAKAKGMPSIDPNLHAADLAVLSEIERWLRTEHMIWIVVDIESIGSDEWIYIYKITYLPKEYWEAKRRMKHFVYGTTSLQYSGGATYSGGWDTWHEARMKGIEKALSMITSEK